jgi:WD40 repeat protein
MADIFLSYSQGAPEPTQALAAELAALNYAVWFDSRLLPGDAFWQVIEDKILAAKAVIVIWTRPALISRGVRAEAQLAYDKHKLICVRTPDVAASEVKLPFNALEQSLVTDRAKIYAALAQLGVRAAPGAAPVLPKGERDAGEAAMAWGHIKDLGDLELFEEFLKHYGEGHAFYARLAQKQIALLKTGRPAATPATTAPATVPLPSAKDVFLRIEPGMHTASIKRISLTADERLMATASDDKTVRLWSLPDGKLIRTLRPPIGPGNDGKVYAVALAPDGSWIAAGGWHKSGDHHIFVFDKATGSVVTRLGPLPNVINDLEISASGDRLAAGLGGQNGVRVWDTRSWRQVAEDKDYAGQVYGLSFASDGRLAATSYDGHIRLYGPDGRLASKEKAPGGAQPFGIAFSPDDARVAIGYTDTTRVDVLSGKTLAHVYSPDASGMDNGDLSKVAWVADGASLAAAGRFQANGAHPVIVWADRGKGKRHAFPGLSNVMDLASRAQGLAFGAYDPAFGLLDADGKHQLFRGPPVADLRGKVREHFLVASDGRRVRFGLKPLSADPWLFDFASSKLTPSLAAPADLHAADIKGLAVADWENTYEPMSGGKALTLLPYERSRSLAIAPDGRSFVLGSEFRLRRFEKDGKELWHKDVPGVVWGVNLAREGRLILAAYGDGTIRWHRTADGEELLALFIHVPEDPKAEKRWVVWTPEGYYTASPGGEDLIGWHVNRGDDQAADFYPAETFRSTFHKPDIVLKALDKADVAPAA